jgi:hypothetical protein
MPADNKAAVRRFYQEVINGRNLDTIDALLTPDRVDHTLAARTPSRPSSSSARFSFFRIQDGKQAEHWGGPDRFSFLLQLGVLPGPGTPGPATPA